MKKEEYKRWYSSCDFIEQEMQFYSFQDFIENGKYIKKLYKQSDYLVKRLYQWYVYSSKMQYFKKNAIWDYLNDYITLEDVKRKR